METQVTSQEIQTVGPLAISAVCKQKVAVSHKADTTTSRKDFSLISSHVTKGKNTELKT